VLGRFKTFTGGEPLRDEEKKIETTIFNHPLDQHGSKGKGKKKRGATPSETKEEAKSVAAGEEASA
jgi:hypothetical protein